MWRNAVANKSTPCFVCERERAPCQIAQAKKKLGDRTFSLHPETHRNKRERQRPPASNPEKPALSPQHIGVSPGPHCGSGEIPSTFPREIAGSAVPFSLPPDPLITAEIFPTRYSKYFVRPQEKAGWRKLRRRQAIGGHAQKRKKKRRSHRRGTYFSPPCCPCHHVPPRKRILRTKPKSAGVVAQWLAR